MVSDNDYVPRSGTIVFDSNSPTLQYVAVTVNGDIKFEANEVFFLHLSNPVGAGIPVIDAIGTIYNDDIEPSFAINDVSAVEGSSGTTPFTFTITRSGNPTSFASIVNYSTTNQTATAPSDYAAVSNGAITFLPNETSKTITINISGDTVQEPNETFLVSMTTITYGLLGRATGIGTIINDDGVPTPSPTPTPTQTPTPNPRIEGDVVNGSGGAAGDNLVLANDVNVIRQMQLGLLPQPAAGSQFQAADVNLDAPGACGNGQIDAGDVTVIRGYNLGLLNGQPLPTKPVCGPTAQVTARPYSLEVVGRIIRAVNTTGISGATLVVSFQLDSQGDEASASFTVNWNPAALTYVSSAPGAGVPSGTNLGLNTSQTASGRLGVLLDATNTYAMGTRQILIITFTVAAAPGSVGTWPVTFSSTPVVQSVSNATGTLLATTFEAGNVVVTTTAAGVSVSGRVTNSNGLGVRGATVVITDQLGQRRTVTTGSFGFYSFDEVESGGSYVIGVTSKRYRFGSRIINVTDSVSDVDFVGLE